MRKSNPAGFVWTCCDTDGDDPGCTYSQHKHFRRKRVRRAPQNEEKKEVVGNSKRARFETSC